MDRKLEFILQIAREDLKVAKADLKDDIHGIRQDIKALSSQITNLATFKFLALGIVIGVSSFFSVLVTMVTLYFKAK